MQKTVSGIGSLKKTSTLAEKLNIRKPLIVGGSILTEKLLRSIPGFLSAPVFSSYHPNPELSDAEAAADLFRKEKCDGFISIGGGSAMDTAKAAKRILQTGNSKNALSNTITDEINPPHIAIPGTAGSGAEATQTAVVYIENRKISLDYDNLLPEGVVLDASLLESLPVYHQKASALDALCQGIESYWSRRANEDSRVHAYLAVLGVLDNLKAYLDGDLHAAQQVLEASHQSGKAIQITRTTAAHAMSYQLSIALQIAHGHACMLTLPALWRHMELNDEMRPLLNDLSWKMRLGSPMMGSRFLKGILCWMNLEKPTAPDEDMIQSLVQSVNSERLRNHPEKLSAEDLYDIYREAFRPLSPMEKQVCEDLWNYYGAGGIRNEENSKI